MSEQLYLIEFVTLTWLNNEKRMLVNGSISVFLVIGFSADASPPQVPKAWFVQDLQPDSILRLITLIALARGSTECSRV